MNEIVSQLHQSVWQNVRTEKSSMVQYLATLVSVGALLGYGNNAVQSNPNMWSLCVLSAQLIFLWIMIVIVENGYAYRLYQSLSIKVEKSYASELDKVFPKGYQEFKCELPDIYLWHLAVTLLLFTIVSFVVDLPIGTTSAASTIVLDMRFIFIGAIVSLTLILLERLIQWLKIPFILFAVVVPIPLLFGMSCLFHFSEVNGACFPKIIWLVITLIVFAHYAARMTKLREDFPKP